MALVRVNKQHPCRVCGRDHYCSVTADGAAVFCTKEPSDEPAKSGTGWWHRLGTPAVNGRANGGTAPIVKYPIHDADGTLVAVHCRVDLPGGGKRFWWELPDGTKKLGRKPETLPLYGVEAVAAAGSPGIVVVTEGEKARDALKSLLVPAVGTVTGADVIPSVASLEPLVGFDVCLWPDNDEKGRAHMAGVARRLIGLGVKPRLFTWPEAPEKGDAADFVAAGLGRDDLNRLYAEAAVVEEAETPADEKTDDPHLTDLGNSKRLVARHGPEIRWCKEWNRWLSWEKTVWDADGTTAVQERAKETALSIYEEAIAAPTPGQAEGLFKWAKASEAARAVTAMASLARSDPAVQIRAEQLDADAYLFNAANGTLELRAWAFREHRRDDLITKSSPVPYDPEAACPRWLAYLERVFAGDAEVIGFVQRAVGYSLTGATGERVMFILHGVGHNGKTTFIEVVAHILGNYAMSTPVETLIAKKDRGIPNDVARLKSARFVSATETEQGDKLAEAFVKAVTGGDRVSARFLHAEWFEFTPQLKLWLATNHRPQISGTDPAIWDRIRLIPFEVEIPEAERDRDLKRKLIEEAPGILSWALEGCRLWQEGGLAEPESIRKATAQYRSDEDVLGAWIEDRCEVQKAVWVSHEELYKSFKDWAEVHGEEKMGAKTFSQRMVERRGITRFRQPSTGIRGYSGVRVVNHNQKQEDGADE